MMRENILLILGLSLSYMTGGELQAYQKSTWDYNTADLAVDDTSSTCYVSGYDIGSWWFVDLGQERVVDSLVISGALDAFNVRVGNDNESLKVGRRSAFKDNALCFFSLAINTQVTGSVQIDCRRPQIGRYVSIQHVDPVSYSQMKLCNVDVLYR